jgi:hypothetical protein
MRRVLAVVTEAVVVSAISVFLGLGLGMIVGGALVVIYRSIGLTITR